MYKFDMNVFSQGLSSREEVLRLQGSLCCKLVSLNSPRTLTDLSLYGFRVNSLTLQALFLVKSQRPQSLDPDFNWFASNRVDAPPKACPYLSSSSDF
mmetsp:Transcript_28736/g.46521  ORF Transcript_28736/g.46521 Transcript_28736/m.46521 type:complete len:97 (+) Transcript_28736:96-386(+)